ncbi:2-hydroxyacid dehydrogenase [Haliangium sp.]|uniref:2-hydroxyacid dehydrogenase n=1 Tax=Haliangium sp. TaxID=2663208 RepID=UPI003D0E89D8
MELVVAAPRDPQGWRRVLAPALAEALPAARLHLWPDLDCDPAAVEVALVWDPPAEMWAALPGLRCVMALGAGVDELLPKLPAGLALTRVVDGGLATRMVDYVLCQVLRAQLDMAGYARAQARAAWQPRVTPPASEYRVGVLGLGAIGAPVAAALARYGYPVWGWSRGPRQLSGVHCGCGPDGLDALLGRSDAVVCLLPLTAATRGLLDARALALLPPGAHLINAGRGGLVVEADLLAALDRGDRDDRDDRSDRDDPNAAGGLGGATLDVFCHEPLPAAHPLWRHPRVTVTPHIASLTDPAAVAAQICANLVRLSAGAPLRHLVDRARGY